MRKAACRQFSFPSCPPHRRALSPRLALLAALCLAPSLPGCFVSRERYKRAQTEIVQLQTRLDEAQEQALVLQGKVRRKDEQIAALQELGPRRLGLLFHVDRIELRDYTGGVNLDDRPGDDGVRVYLRPVDRSGSTLKAAGRIRVQIFDLAAPPAENLVGEREWAVDSAGEAWTSFIFQHYALTCPWKDSPPRHEEITVRVEFLDYLTGRRFTEQMTCKVRLAAEEAVE